MKKKALNVTILSLLMIVLASTAIVGGTYALWSSETKVESHLTSGNLKIKLERTNLTKCNVNQETGYLATTTNNDVIDFTNSSSTNSNIFGIENGELIVPGSYYEATLKLSNNGTVAFDYVISLSLKDTLETTLAKQINVYFDDVEKGYLYNETNNSSYELKTGIMSKKDTYSFKVKVEFKNLENVTNNLAMDKDTKFDLKVVATQKNNKN